MITNKKALNAINHFQVIGQPQELSPYGNGHINDTYLVTMKEEGPRYILQKINKHVFKRPDEVVQNIAGVTEHVRKEVEANGGDVDREVLNLIHTVDDENYYLDEEDEYWRVYLFVERTNTFQLPDTPELFYESAKAFGNFGALLNEYPSEKLNVTIPGFHDTTWRYEQLRRAMKEDPKSRLKDVGAELKFVFEREEEAATLVNMQNNGELPVRVTHNDTKLNNVLFDDKTDVGICVIDLDTMMPGLSANDFGDAIRFGANTASEDEGDLDKCELDLDMFRAYAKGYLESAGKVLEANEIDVLPMGAKLMTLECGVRFLTDYLNGDIYFRIQDTHQNLRRARNQFKLVYSMEEKWNDMCEIVAKIEF